MHSAPSVVIAGARAPARLIRDRMMIGRIERLSACLSNTENNSDVSRTALCPGFGDVGAGAAALVPKVAQFRGSRRWAGFSRRIKRRRQQQSRRSTRSADSFSVDQRSACGRTCVVCVRDTVATTRVWIHRYQTALARMKYCSTAIAARRGLPDFRFKGVRTGSRVRHRCHDGSAKVTLRAHRSSLARHGVPSRARTPRRAHANLAPLDSPIVSASSIRLCCQHGC